jgi:hypothetical protein
MSCVATRFSARIAAKHNKSKTQVSQPQPNQTKRSASAFIAFCHAKRHEVIAANPTLTSTFGETGKLLIDIWNQMSEMEKEEYYNKL